MKWIFFLSCLVLISSTSSAKNSDLETKFAKCANKSQMADRLVCYDMLATEHNLVTRLDVDDTSSKTWRVEVETSPIDDTETVFMSTIALEHSKIGYKTVRPSLHLRCKEGDLDVFIVWGVFIGTDETNVTMRFGKNEAYDESWSISTDRKATFARNPKFKLSFLEKADTFLARVTPYGESPVLSKFDTRGLSDAAVKLKEACNID